MHSNIDKPELTLVFDRQMSIVSLAAQNFPSYEFDGRAEGVNRACCVVRDLPFHDLTARSMFSPPRSYRPGRRLRDDAIFAATRYNIMDNLWYLNIYVHWVHIMHIIVNNS